jgi:ADP-dependent NAD(P)H-hydrate dehydratase
MNVNLPFLPPRIADANKGSFGRVLVVAGSRGMSGAAVLCGGGALRGGAGLVQVATTAEVLSIVAAANPCYMTLPLPHDAQGRFAPQAAAEVDGHVRHSSVVVAGPGLGQGPGVKVVVAALLAQNATPLVLDADALNSLAADLAPLQKHTRTPILTPHPGEFARLLGCDVPTVQERRTELAVRFAVEHNVVLVLKGQGTIVTDGRRVYVNTTGNPGMATGGSGDVLGGVIAALAAQGLEAFTAAQLGVYLHGLAGDLARDALGETSLIASDLLDFLPRAFMTHARNRPAS